MVRETIAAQLFTLRDLMTTPEDIVKVLTRVRDIGYKAVQLSGVKYPSASFIKEVTESLGLTVCITHTTYDRLINDLDAVIADHKLWNCPTVGLGFMPVEFSRTPEGYRAFIDTINTIAAKLSQSGLKFGYHNHHFELEKYDGLTGLEQIMNETEPSRVSLILDTYWIQSGGGNPEKWIEKYAGRIDVVHLKDMAIFDDKQAMAEIGEGNLDWPGILAACRKAGVKWYAVEQDVCRRSPLESLEISYKYLEKLL